ncbi:PilZ domain-containing protein [Alkalimarinus alittae]|uniref:Cyclic diguanosine monophosphate-binding protein n=1 Tax=Alkalimarinus alittae TaxID=2961619 RepID=A0ABY6N0T6_9ALTE|nr:PilZ domain-containing protein [Alkalimarinus alittae]UZE95627.1 PilZ domain-containing protein [Alkalimarinus alittae]
MDSKHANDDKRHFSRILFDANCTLHQGESEWSAELLDISLSGMLVNCPDLPQANLDNPFEAVIALSDAGESIVMSIKLVHKESSHLGFKCEYIDIDSITHLKRLVELNLGDSELLNRELSALTHHQQEIT